MDILSLGINKGKAKQFNNKGITTVEELINYLPKKYMDFRHVTPISQVKDGEIVSIVGRIANIKASDKFTRIKVIDNNNWFMFITWFNQSYIAKTLNEGDTYNFCGLATIDEKYGTKNMINPMYFSNDLQKYNKIIPTYSKIAGMSDDFLLNSINTALSLVDKSEYLEPNILDKYELLNKKLAINGIHQPKDMEDVRMAKKRVLFDDLFYFASMLKLREKDYIEQSFIKTKKADTIKPFLKSLPFKLTEDQLETVRAIFKDMKIGNRINALIQGDVGSGKTIVAFLLMFILAENKYQSALMCPTNVLAKQHFDEMSKFCEQMGYKVAFLNGTMKKREKKAVLEGIKDGTIDMVIGTHAIISEDVEFKNLGLTIVDEEHRFGVVQRDLMNEKSKTGIHSITMSATPIPRSLALTIYGSGIKIYNINQMPMGRKPVKTILSDDKFESYRMMKQEIDKGRQCYVVCPLIEQSDSDIMKGVKSVDEVYADMVKYFAGSGVRISVINGKMKAADVEAEIDKFANKESDIIISTTIIEVGVNIPNATLMVISNAERFGLAQLHQLRGRVGRGIEQSYCMLLSNKENNEKLMTMVKTTNGFEIAEADIRLRGAGDFIGTKQSGDNKYVMLMLAYPKLFNAIKADLDLIFRDEKRNRHYKPFFYKIDKPPVAELIE